MLHFPCLMGRVATKDVKLRAGYEIGNAIGSSSPK
jgi:hypothetical protein